MATESVAAAPELFRLISRAFMQDPYPALDELRATASAVPIENNGMRMWVVTAYDDARAVLADQDMKKDLFADRKTILARTEVRTDRRPRLPRELRRNMLDRDGHDHDRLRAVVGSTFGTSAARELAPRIRKLADHLLDDAEVGVPVDLISSYTSPLAMTVIADELGIAISDREGFPVWENDILTAPDIESIEEAAQAIVSFARRQLAEKEREPGDDLLTRIALARVEGLIDDDEAVSTVTVLLTGGMEPSSAISSGVLTLLRNPGQLGELLADPSLMPGCVDEILRYESPFRMLTPRFSTTPVQVGDTTIPAYELILVSAAAANRDATRFPDPSRFDIRRTATGHLGFGRGTHRCLGAKLGWLEVSIGLTALFARFPGIRLAEADEAHRWRTGMFMRRLDTLPVVLAA